MRAFLAALLKAGTGQIAALAFAALSVKILAVIGGPAAIGTYSLLRQIQQTLTSFASVGAQNAIVQGVPSRSSAARSDYIFAGWILVGCASTIAFVAAVMLAKQGASMLFPHSIEGTSLVVWSAAAAVLGALLIVARSLLNAHMAIGAVAKVNIVTALAACLLAYPAARAYQGGSEIALVGILMGSLIIGLLFSLVYLREIPTASAYRIRWRCTAARSFMVIGMPSLLSGLIGMGVVLALRALVVREHGLHAAGYFDAAWSVSLTFVVVFLTSVQTYLLPVLSDKDAEAVWRNVLFRTLRLVLQLAVPIIVAMILLKPFILELLYSDEFLPALDLLRWTLAGDYVRVAGWLLATALVARADMRTYLAVELAWNVVFFAAGYSFIRWGIEGVGPAYVVAYLIYLLLLTFLLYKRHGAGPDREIVTLWSGGALIIVATSAIAWSSDTASWQAVMLMLIALGFSAFSMTPTERTAARSAILRIGKLGR